MKPKQKEHNMKIRAQKDDRTPQQKAFDRYAEENPGNPLGNPHSGIYGVETNAETQPTREQQPEQTGHTPGPWTMLSNSVVTVGIEGKGAIALIGEEPREGGLHLSRGIAEANGRLIAAAPEMLKALQLALVQWPAAHREQPRIIAQIEAAIAKAEGRAS